MTVNPCPPSPTFQSNPFTPFKDWINSHQAGLTQFQAAARKRESMRLKLQMGAAPGILEKDLADKIRVEESVCKVLVLYSYISSPPAYHHLLRELQGFWAPARMKHNALRLPKTYCWANWGLTCWSSSWTSWGGGGEALPGNRAIPATLLSAYLI